MSYLGSLCLGQGIIPNNLRELRKFLGCYLREGKSEVDYLRDEKEHYGLGEVTKDGDNREDHAGPIAIGITNEYL